MKYVKTKLGNFSFPSEIEKELKSLTNRELIISFLNDDAKIDVYKLQELQDRELITGDEKITELKERLSKIVKYGQFAVEDLKAV